MSLAGCTSEESNEPAIFLSVQHSADSGMIVESYSNGDSTSTTAATIDFDFSNTTADLELATFGLTWNDGNGDKNTEWGAGGTAGQIRLEFMEHGWFNITAYATDIDGGRAETTISIKIDLRIEWAEANDKDWEQYWKNPETNLIHFIGKDNIVFHCIIFPIMLRMFGDFILPKNVPANEFLNLEGNKISTSRNWAVWLHEYLIDFPNMQDVLRYVLTSTCPETKDNDFTWKDFQIRNNSELVAIYGNFTNRVLSLINKYYDGKIPNPDSKNNTDELVLNEVKSLKSKIELSLNEFKFREAIKNLMNIARVGNKHLAETEPWKIKESDPERVEQILQTSYFIITYLSVLSEPFIPFTSYKLMKMIGLNNFSWDMLDNISENIDYSFKIDKIEMLFRKIEDSEIDLQINKLNGNSSL